MSIQQDSIQLKDMYKKKMVSQKAISARKFLKKWYPSLYYRIQGFFNFGNISFEEYFLRIKTWIDIYHIDYERIKKHLFEFIGIENEPVEYFPEKPYRKTSYQK